jgi:hypothetical protein
LKVVQPLMYEQACAQSLKVPACNTLSQQSNPFLVTGNI